MNKKQYNNVIDYTLKHEQVAKTDDSLSIARAIFNNLGVALPQGDIKQVYDIIKTNNYMGWRTCTMQEAQVAADNGIAAIGISEDRIVVLSATDEEEPVTENASVMTLSKNTSAYAVAGLEYYAYGYGTTNSSTTDSGGSTTTTTPISYCGGSNYRDVTKHNMVLHTNGYYVCTRCGYTVKSPELEDKDILSSDDYLKIVSTMHYYTQCKLLAEKYPLTSAYYNMQAHNAELLIDTIRSQSKYASRYSYINSSGVYHCNDTNNNTLSLIDIADINLLNIGIYNGVYESICSAVLAYYCPPVAALVDVLNLVTSQMNALDFGAFVAGMYEDVSESMLKYSKALTIASLLLEMATSEVSLEDKVVRINLDIRTSAHYIYDKNNKIKAVRIFYP